MTNQEAIDVLKNAAWLGTHEDRQRMEEAVDIAISALQAQESVDKELKCLRTEIFFLKAEKEAEKVDIFPEWTEEEKKENRAYAKGYTDAYKEIKTKGDLISREMALKESHQIVIDGDAYDVVQVETLMALPSAQPEIIACGEDSLTQLDQDLNPNGDLISRQGAME